MQSRKHFVFSRVDVATLQHATKAIILSDDAQLASSSEAVAKTSRQHKMRMEACSRGDKNRNMKVDDH